MKIFDKEKKTFDKQFNEKKYCFELIFDSNKINEIKNKFKNYELSEFDKEEYNLIELDIQNVNNNWNKEYLYLDKFDDLNYSSKLKYMNSRIDLYNLNVDKPPVIRYIKNNQIMFTDGRNRFSNLRDIGVDKIYFLVEKYVESSDTESSNSD